MIKKSLALLLVAVTVALLLCGCTESVIKPVSEIFNDIKAEISFDNVTELSQIRLLDRYYGITEDLAEEYAGCVNASGVSQEEIVLVKAVDENAAAAVKEKLDNRYQTKLTQNRNYNPEEAAMIEKCTVEQHGLYVSMIVSDKAEQIKAIYYNDIGEE